MTYEIILSERIVLNEFYIQIRIAGEGYTL
jgi:hypothetical protein